jgi:hypothetical protein
MFDIGGITDYEMIGKDTIRGDSFEKFPLGKGRIPQATETIVKNSPDQREILWIDIKGKRRQGIIRVKKKQERRIK